MCNDNIENSHLEFSNEEAKKYFDIGVAHYEEDEYDEAIAALTKSIEHGESGQSYGYRGLVYTIHCEYEKAYDDFKNTIRLGHDVEDGFYRLGQKCKLIEHYDDAIKYFTSAIELATETALGYVADSYCQRAICKKEQDRYQEAIEDFDKALELEADEISYLYSKAYTLSLTDQKERCQSIFDDVVQRDPRLFTYKNKAIAMERIGDYTQAIFDYTKAIELVDSASEKSELYVLRAGIYKLLDNMEKSWEDLQTAIEADPDTLCTYLDTLEMYITTSSYEGGMSFIETYEDKIQSLSNNSETMLYLYLKFILYKVAGKQTAEIENELNERSQRYVELLWYFGHTENWVLEANLKEADKKDIQRVTKWMKFMKYKDK